MKGQYIALGFASALFLGFTYRPADETIRIMPEHEHVKIALELVKVHEGYRKYPYKDVLGNLTCGYGLALYKSGMSEKAAEFAALEELERLDKGLHLLLGSHFNTIGTARKAALLDLCYNIGIYGFQKFIKTQEAIKAGDFDLAARQLEDSLWFKQHKSWGSKRAEKIVSIMRSGELPP